MKMFKNLLKISVEAMLVSTVGGAEELPSTAQPPSGIDSITITRSSDGNLLRIKEFSTDTVRASQLSQKWVSFSQLLKVSPELSEQDSARTLDFQSLTPPFSDLQIKSLGLGLTYSDHAKDVSLQGAVLFEKNSVPTRIQDPIVFRNSLDYEAEVALLMHRQEPELFGFLLHNDLSDRMIQIQEFDEKNMAPGFGRAKSFPGSNAFGPIVLIGDESVWDQIEVKLIVKGQLRQTVRPAQNILRPMQIHKLVFTASALVSPEIQWVLIGTGTPSGTIFRSPNTWEKIKLIFSSAFDFSRAKQAWVKSFDFLKPGDKLEFVSEQLGKFHTEVVQSDPH